jgi:hypothetical protein
MEPRRTASRPPKGELLLVGSMPFDTDFRTRLDLARAHLDDFGAGGPCGYGRVDSSELPVMMRAHHDGLAELRRRSG